MSNQPPRVLPFNNVQSFEKMQVNPPKKGAHLKEDINISKEKYVLDEPVALELTKMNLNGTILIQKSMEPLISGVRPSRRPPIPIKSFCQQYRLPYTQKNQVNPSFVKERRPAELF